VLLELAAANPRQHHTRQPAGLGVLAFALALSWAHVGLLKAFPAVLCLHVNVAFAVASVGALGAGLVLLNCYFAEASGVGFIAVGTLRRLDGIPWLASLALLFAATFVPAFYFDLYVNTFANPGKLFTTFVALPALAVVFRYFDARAALQQFAAQALAQTSLVASAAKAEVLEGLLEGLVPAHVPEAAREEAQLLAVTGQASQMPTFLEFWQAMSILQVEVAFTDGGFAGLAEAWCAVASCVDDVGALYSLELVQATGDSFLIGGPFLTQGDDGLSVVAARGAMDVVRDIVKAIGTTGHITAVATSGNAYGTLVGAALLTYRLFGAAVRENNAIMAAAPRMSASSPVGARGDAGASATPNVVFLASDSFVKQERNFTVPRASAAGHDGGLSVVVAPDSSVGVVAQSHPVDESGPCDSSLAAESGATSPRRGRVAFAAPMLWRVRGLGVAQVSTVSAW
jgi:hypothetical protein